MSLLDDIINGATDEQMSTANLLRKVQVAATRVEAREVVDWAKRELNGYTAEEVLPASRAARPATVRGMFSGPMGSSLSHGLERPADTQWDSWFQVEFRQPIAEIEAFAAADDDPSISWPPFVIARYEAEGHFSFEMHALFSAAIVLPRQMLRGVIDKIKNSALEFALELQGANAAAGSVGGPTVGSDAAVAGTVYTVTNNIYGHGANLSAGPNARQRSSVTAGDFEGLLSAIKQLGLDADAAAEFATAIRDERSVEGPKVRSFLERVRAGAIEVGSGVAAKVVTAELATVALQYLGTL